MTFHEAGLSPDSNANVSKPLSCCNKLQNNPVRNTSNPVLRTFFEDKSLKMSISPIILFLFKSPSVVVTLTTEPAEWDDTNRKKWGRGEVSKGRLDNERRRF